MTAEARQLLRTRRIERVGFCADGDRCPRYRCTTCGEYWTGNAEHRCGEHEGWSGVGSPKEQLDERIVGWMKEALEQQCDVEICAARVLDQVRRAVLAESFLELYGPAVILEIWRAHHQVGTVDQVAAAAAAAADDAELPPRRPYRPVPARQLPSYGYPSRGSRPNPPHIDVGELARADATLEALVRADGAWIRLGDLDRRQCRVLQMKHDQAARAFGQLADELADGETVRQRWTGDQLRELFGDTLDGAPARPPST